MQVKLTSLLGLGALLLAGCAGPYHAYNNGTGYTDAPIRDGVYEVAYVGRSGTPQLEIRNLATLRAADLATKNGARYFEILDSKYEARKSLQLIPGTTYVYGGGGWGYCYGGPAFVVSNPGYIAEVRQPVVTLKVALRKSPSSKTLDAWKILDQGVKDGLVKRDTS
ncbi:MAG: hypothetical protein AAGK14_01845 [Verrucomicrobiota bacterium]